MSPCSLALNVHFVAIHHTHQLRVPFTLFHTHNGECLHSPAGIWISIRHYTLAIVSTATNRTIIIVETVRVQFIQHVGYVSYTCSYRQPKIKTRWTVDASTQTKRPLCFVAFVTDTLGYDVDPSDWCDKICMVWIRPTRNTCFLLFRDMRHWELNK